MEIKELFTQELNDWKKANIDLFGLDTVDAFASVKEINDSLNTSCNLYWNTEEPCKLVKYLDRIDKNSDVREPNSFWLTLNIFSFCVDMYAYYKNGNDTKLYKIGSLPLPTNNLTWIINNREYTARVAAIRDGSTFLYKRKDGSVSGCGFVYKDGQFTELYDKSGKTLEKQKAFEKLSTRVKLYIESMIKKSLTLDNFEEALKEFKNPLVNSITNYKFTRFEYFEEMLKTTKKYATPKSEQLFGVNTMMLKTTETRSLHNIGYPLVMVSSTIEALENYRTVINIFAGDFKPAFKYTDTVGVFDAFKTPTSRDAGRTRMLLDNVSVHDGCLFINDKDMFSFDTQEDRLSCLTFSPFCVLNKPKRLMMNAKMVSQSVPLEDEEDSIAHKTKARVLFADIEGLTYGDSIIISRSFANRLTTTVTDQAVISKKSSVYNKYLRKDIDLDLNCLFSIYPKKTIYELSAYTNIKVLSREDLIGYERIIFSYDIPFFVGDKLTNLHGSKGTCGRILEDDEMPRLIQKAGEMEAGIFDVIISGFSTMRRGSIGQIYEAWMLANNIKLTKEQMYIPYIKKNYSDDIKNFSENSIVEYKGQRIKAPVGINYIMRLHHHAFTKVSAYNFRDSKQLKLGEMEKLNLFANGCYNVLNELAVRSPNKYILTKKMLDKLELNGEIPKNIRHKGELEEILKTLGYYIDFSAGKAKVKDIQIKDDARNKVTSHRLFKTRRIIDKNGEYLFNDESIFSEKIFGQFNRCKCGNLQTDGICDACGTRVIKYDNPDFYIELDVDVPKTIIRCSKEVESLLKYQSFYYKGEIISFDLKKIDIREYDINEVKIGKDAVLNFISEEEYNQLVTRKISVPHTKSRPFLKDKESFILTEINKNLLELLRKKNKLELYLQTEDTNPFYTLSFCQEAFEMLDIFRKNIINSLCSGKNSAVYREAKGQKITGAARGVITNNFDLDENVVEIGYMLLPSLYPAIYEKHCGESGVDLDAVNEEIKDKVLLLNRQPTIGEKSILAMRPVFSADESTRYVIQINPIISSALSSDYDGDVVNLIALYSKNAIDEAEYLLPSLNFRNCCSSEIRNGIFEDLEYVGRSGENND